MGNYIFKVTREAPFEDERSVRGFAEELSRMAKVGFHDPNIVVEYSRDDSNDPVRVDWSL